MLLLLQTPKTQDHGMNQHPSLEPELTLLQHPRARFTIRHAVAPGVAVLRQLWLPFVMIQFVGLAVVVVYFTWAPFATTCDRIGEVKKSMGVLFAMLVMPVAAGVVPELFKTFTGIDRVWDKARLKHLAYAMAVFCIAGLFVDTFYQALAHFFGNSNGIKVVAAKVLIDQLIYSTTVGVPWMALAFGFERVGFSFGKLRTRLADQWYLKEVMPMLLVCWVYWFPMTILMYMLPTSLTFVFGATASAASAILLVAVARRK